MAYWKTKGSKRTKSLKTKSKGVTTKRVIGRKNYTDKSYKKTFGKKPRRKANYRNTTDGALRVSSGVKPKSYSRLMPLIKTGKTRL